jgi:hypothetical protein
MTSIVSVWLGADLKKQWECYCSTKKTNASASIRQLIRFLLAKDNLLPSATLTDVGEDGVKRIEIRLRTSQYIELVCQSQRQGFSHTRYIVGLVDAHLAKINTPVLGQYELDALTASTTQLLRLGTNLNQVVRAINRSPLETDLVRIELIQEIHQEVNSLAQSVAGLIQTNLERWNNK